VFSAFYEHLKGQKGLQVSDNMPISSGEFQLERQNSWTWRQLASQTLTSSMAVQVQMNARCGGSWSTTEVVLYAKSLPADALQQRTDTPSRDSQQTFNQTKLLGGIPFSAILLTARPCTENT
jgi:hypothetical protein